MVDGILAYVKAVVKQTTIKYVKETSQVSNQPKKVEKDSGSSKAGDIHRPISVLPGREKEYTPPQRNEMIHAEMNQSNMQGDNNENDKSPVNHVQVVNNHLYKHVSYNDVTNSDLQGVNVGTDTRGTQPSKEELKDKDSGSWSSKSCDLQRLETIFPKQEE